MSKIDWTEEKLQYIRDHYPTETAQDIADVIGCSDCTVNVIQAHKQRNNQSFL